MNIPPPVLAVPPGLGRADPLQPRSGLYWNAPNPYGYPTAVDTAGTVAAPMLAGFTTALIGLILSIGAPPSIPQRDPALVTLVAATVALLCCVQCSFWAKQYTVTPNQILEWWPELALGDTASDERHDELRAVQWRYAYLARLWQGRARWTYDAGIVALLLSLCLVLVPPSRYEPWRWLAVGMASAALASELVWVFAPGRGLRRLFPGPRDVRDRDEVKPEPEAYPWPREAGPPRRNEPPQ